MKRYLELLIIISLSACQGNLLPPLTPKPTPVLSPIYRTDPLTPQSIHKAVELSTLSVPSAGPIAAVAFTADSRGLVVVHGTEGSLRRWRIEDGVLLSTADIGPVGMAAVGLDADAKLLATGAGKITPAVQAGYDADIHGARLWNTQSNTLLLEIDPASEPFTSSATDVALSPNGRWLAIAAPSSLDVWDTSTGKPASLSTIIGVPKSNGGQAIITAVTFDSTGEWLAYADDDGGLHIERWHSETSSRLQILPNFIKGTPLALAIDPSRRRVAIVSDELFVVGSLESWWDNTLFTRPFAPSPLAGLAFNSDGSLLAVATSSGWQIWSVEGRRLLMENKQPTYAVAFSPDSRLVAWGDTKGIVHVWGAPTP